MTDSKRLAEIEARGNKASHYSGSLYLEQARHLLSELRARDAAIKTAIDMIENCAGGPTNPDSLPQMLLHHLRAALNPEPVNASQEKPND